MKKLMKSAEQVAKEISALFRKGDEVLLIMAGHDPEDGEQAPDNAMLFAVNCLHIGGAKPCFEATITPRWAKILLSLTKLAMRAADWFVVGYRLKNRTEHHLAWSDHLDDFQVANILLGYVQHLAGSAANDMGDLPADNPYPLKW